VFNTHDQAHTRERLGHVLSRLEPVAPKVCRLLEDAEEDLIAFYLLPPEHWTKLRSTNPLEGVNKEIGRRSDVVGIFPNDGAMMRLAGALLSEQNDCHEGLAMTAGAVVSSPRRRLGAVRSPLPDARRTSCSISASTGAPARPRGARLMIMVRSPKG
jgi:transposase-like protein